MRERLKRVVLKTTVPETVPGVRIPLPPPATLTVTRGPKAFEIVQLNPHTAISKTIPARGETLKPLVIFPIDGEAAILIPSHACGPAFIELVFALYDLALGGSDIRGECKQEVTGNPFLHGDAGARIRVVAAQSRIDGQTGEPGKLLNSSANLARRSLR